MEFKIQAGGTIDLLTKEEVGSLIDQQTRDFDKMISEGMKYGKLSSSLNSAVNTGNTSLYSGGVYQLGGPEPGFVWSLKNISYSNLGTTGCDILIDGNNPSDLVYGTLKASGTLFPGENGIIISGGHKFMLGAQNTLVASSIVLYYLELPIKDIGKL